MGTRFMSWRTTRMQTADVHLVDAAFSGGAREAPAPSR